MKNTNENCAYKWSYDNSCKLSHLIWSCKRNNKKYGHSQMSVTLVLANKLERKEMKSSRGKEYQLSVLSRPSLYFLIDFSVVLKVIQVLQTSQTTFPPLALMLNCCLYCGHSNSDSHPLGSNKRGGKQQRIAKPTLIFSLPRAKS